jgi:hypothetical protein
MWMRRAVIATALALSAPAAAAGQSLVSGLGASSTQQTVPVFISGRVVVDFHGDAAAGCAARGVCGYSGTVSWIPSTRATLQLNVSRARGHARYTIDVFPALGNGPGLPMNGVTIANVTETPDLTSASTQACVDADSAGDDVTLAVRRGQVFFAIGSRFAPLLTTRCAGPRDAAILRLLPTPQLSLAAVRRGLVSVPILAARSFSADGFAGTVTSDVVFHLARPGRTTRVRAQSVGKPRRALEVSYHATLTGSVVEQITGGPSAACEPLGACGLTGTLTLHPPTARGTGQINAAAPAGRPAPSLLDAAGFGVHGALSGISIWGQASWTGRGTAAIHIGRGLSQCHDTSLAAPGFVLLLPQRHRLVAVLSAATPTASACPGPVSTNGLAGALAAGGVPIGNLARRRIRIPLTTGTSFNDYGYHVRTVPHLTLILHRVAMRTGLLPGL